MRFSREKYATLLNAFAFLLLANSFAVSADLKELGRKIEESIFIFNDEKYSIETKQCLVSITRKNTDCEYADAVSEVETSIFFDEIDRVELLGSRKEYRTIYFFISKNESKSKIAYAKCSGERVVSNDEIEIALLVKGDFDRNLIRNIESVRKNCAK